MSGDTAKGSTVTDPGPVSAEAMRTGTSDAPAAPVLVSGTPLKTPVTSDGPVSAKSDLPGGTIAPTLPASAAVPNKVVAQPVPAGSAK